MKKMRMKRIIGGFFCVLSLLLSGMPGVPGAICRVGITNAVFVNEETAYMRDYIYDEGVLKEVRFDRVSNH